jgi:hypothetical protein
MLSRELASTETSEGSLKILTELVLMDFEAFSPYIFRQQQQEPQNSLMKIKQGCLLRPKVLGIT